MASLVYWIQAFSKDHLSTSTQAFADEDVTSRNEFSLKLEHKIVMPATVFEPICGVSRINSESLLSIIDP
jgi:hypothetical protein